MAWSKHIGGIYHRDSVNMVTKTAPSTFTLMGKDVFDDLKIRLEKDEKRLLAKHLNMRLKNSWVYKLRNTVSAFLYMIRYTGSMIFGDHLHYFALVLYRLMFGTQSFIENEI